MAPDQTLHCKACVELTLNMLSKETKATFFDVNFGSSPKTRHKVLFLLTGCYSFPVEIQKK